MSAEADGFIWQRKVPRKNEAPFTVFDRYKTAKNYFTISIT
jgi:hypothetical protein